MTEQELTDKAEAFVREKGFNGLANHTLVKNWMAEFAAAYADSCNASLVKAHKDIIRITNDGFKSHSEARTLAREASRNAIAANEKGKKDESPCGMCLRVRSSIEGYCRICDTDFDQE